MEKHKVIYTWYVFNGCMHIALLARTVQEQVTYLFPRIRMRQSTVIRYFVIN